MVSDIQEMVPAADPSYPSSGATPPPPPVALNAGAFRRNMETIAWLALLVPVLFTLIRLAFGVVGLNNFFYWFTAAWVFIIAQLIVAAFIRRRAHRTSPSAAGTLTTTFTLLAIILHFSTAFLLDDGSFHTRIPSIAESLFGMEQFTAYDYVDLVGKAWLVSHAAAIIAAWYESRWSVIRKQAAR